MFIYLGILCSLFKKKKNKVCVVKMPLLLNEKNTKITDFFTVQSGNRLK